MTLDEFKKKESIVAILEQRGFKFRGAGKGLISKCPFHEDKNPSFSVDPVQNVWNCHAGCGGGSVIDLLARLENSTPADIIKKYIPRDNPAPRPEPKPVIEKIYSYTDEHGAELYQAVRMFPKSFRQRRQENGQWVWNMEGQRRVLYRLPQVLSSERVWIVEGEKDADSLVALGYAASCNVGGAGKWLDGYTDALKGKEVVLCGDNDAPGQKHINLVFESIAGKVKNTRRVKVPDSHKDITDYLESLEPNTETRRNAVDQLLVSVPVLIGGIDIPIRRLSDLEDDYREHVKTLGQNEFRLGSWLPSLNNIRGLVPGELVTVLAATGVGKTAVLQNIARHTSPLPTVLFEMELPGVLVYERFLSISSGMTGSEIEDATLEGIQIGQRIGSAGLRKLNNVFVCTEARLTLERLEKLIGQSELVIGERPKVVMLDYVQLLAGGFGGSRYERMSTVAEELKIIAKAQKIILIIASQVARNDGEDPEVGLHDAKDSGSIENSSGLVLGVWRDPKDKGRMFVKVLKNTKGMSGAVVPCLFEKNMRIVELCKTSDVPSPEEFATYDK